MEQLEQIHDLNYYLTYWGLQALAMGITVLLIPRLRLSGITGALFIVVSIALVNSFWWDATLFFEIPDTLSLHSGLLLLANGVIFWILVKLLPGIEVEGLLPAVAAPVVFTVCSIFVSKYAGVIDWSAVMNETVEIVAQVRSYFQTAKT